MTKSFGGFFVVLSSVTSLKKHFIVFHKQFWQLLWNLFEHFFRTYEVVENTNFQKKTILPVEKKLWHFFLVVSNMTNVMEEVYKDPEGNLRSIVQATEWSFLRT